MPLLLPSLISNNSSNSNLADIKHFCQPSLGYLTQGIYFADLRNFTPTKLGLRLFISARNFFRGSPRPMIIPALKATGINARRMFVASLKSFWIKPRSIPVSPRRPLGMLSESVSIPGWTTALFNHILHIVSVSPEPEMVGIHATSIIARVADEEPIHYRSLMDPVRKAVGEMLDSSNLEHSVSFVGYETGPVPASGFWVYFYFLFKIPLSFWRKNNLASVCGIARSLFSGGHSNCMSIVRAFGSLDTAPTLDLFCPSSVANKA